MLKSSLCDYSDVYIVVKGNITVNNPQNLFWDRFFVHRLIWILTLLIKI